MKRFLKRIFVFVIPMLVIAIGVSFGAKSAINAKPVFQLPKTTNALILGHSQPECAFNDSLISNTKNMAQGGEAYFYTYQKIKKLLPDNPQIKTVYLSFSNNQIEPRMDEWTYDDEHVSNYFPKYAAQLDADDYALLLQYNYKAVLSGEIKAIKNNLSFLIKGENNFLAHNNWGGYLYLKRNKLDSIIKVNYINTIKKEFSAAVSTINVHYLEKIVAFCQQQNVKLVFYRTPVHPILFEAYNEPKFQNLRKQKFNQIPFLDFHDFKLTNDEMGDFDHLNYKGARKFSHYFDNFIKKTEKGNFHRKFRS